MIQEMFHAESNAREGTVDWARELFMRAYFDGEGPFSQVCRRLSLGYSVLAYVPGNCMAAAASLVQKKLSGWSWKEYLQEPGEGGIEAVWSATSGLVGLLRQWIDNSGGNRPAAIFHNLDFLSDGRGGIYHHPAAHTAVASLVAGARQGVVFGMTDRDEPDLPSPISRAFTEQLRLDEIPSENFHKIVPTALGEKLRSWGSLTDGSMWLLATRLRFTDPLRANRILHHAHQGQNSFDGVLEEIVRSTQTVNFQRPEDLSPVQSTPSGVDPTILADLEDRLIRPFVRWKKFQGDRQACVRMMEKLPPGAILHGPPGTGKTFLARWIAAQIGLPVRTISGGEVRASLYGETERNVRALFRDARRAAPCVLILDDADDLLRNRGRAEGSVASADRAVVNEFLQQMQGYRGRLEGVLVILTTNQFGELDPAAVTRLPVRKLIPYPVDTERIRDLVLKIADDFDYLIDATVCDALVVRFSETLKPGGITDPLKATDNLFSPREIQQAMRRLETWEGVEKAERRYQPTLDDVERMKKDYLA